MSWCAEERERGRETEHKENKREKTINFNVELKCQTFFLLKNFHLLKGVFLYQKNYVPATKECFLTLSKQTTINFKEEKHT